MDIQEAMKTFKNLYLKEWEKNNNSLGHQEFIREHRDELRNLEQVFVLAIQALKEKQEREKQVEQSQDYSFEVGV